MKHSDFGHTLWLVSPLLRRMNVQSDRHVERCGCHTQAQRTNTNAHTNISPISVVSYKINFVVLLNVKFVLMPVIITTGGLVMEEFIELSLFTMWKWF